MPHSGAPAAPRVRGTVVAPERRAAEQAPRQHPIRNPGHACYHTAMIVGTWDDTRLEMLIERRQAGLEPPSGRFDPDKFDKLAAHK